MGGRFIFLPKTKNKPEQSWLCSGMAAEEGFEPSQTESESVVLPLHNSAKLTTKILYPFFYKCQAEKFKIAQKV